MMENDRHQQTPDQRNAIIRRRNYVVFFGIIALALLFFIITIIRMGLS